VDAQISFGAGHIGKKIRFLHPVFGGVTIISDKTLSGTMTAKSR